MKLEPLDAPTCPLCGRPNGCAAVAAGSFQVDCWCRSVSFPPELLARVPGPQRGTACICRDCAEGAQGGDAVEVGGGAETGEGAEAGEGAAASAGAGPVATAMEVDSLDALRRLYAQPTERVRSKQIGFLDEHCRRFIALSPFVVLSTCDDGHNADASPRGGDPGFVKVDGQGRLLIADSPGNNRLDSLENIVRTGKVGLLFMIPGFDETLRVNGSASLSTAPEDIALCTTERRTPKLVIRVTVREAYLHCAKAFLRSRLWSESAKVDRSAMPTIGQIIADQTGLAIPYESREDMERRYAPDL